MTDEVLCDVCYGVTAKGMPACHKCGGRGRIPINWSRPLRPLATRNRNIRILSVMFWIGLALLLVFCEMRGCESRADDRPTYVERLEALAGTPYGQLNCTQYVCQAHRSLPCSALKMYTGCDGQLRVISEYRTIAEMNESELQPGDVADFHGGHVAAYIGNGVWMDSDPAHSGVGKINLKSKSSGDPWFYGNIRVLRWNQ